MRQSTLAFGQRPLEVPPPITQPVQALKESVPEAKDKVHPFFAKRARKEEGKSGKSDVKGKGSGDVSNSSVQPLSKKQMLSGTSKSTSISKQWQTPWPGKGESHIEPDDQNASPSSEMIGLTAFEKRNNSVFKASVIQTDEHSWSWLHSTKEPTPEMHHEKQGHNIHHLTVQEYITSRVDLHSCLDSNGQLPKSIKHAKETAESKRNEKSSNLWTDKYRPKEAEHVLGNEKQSVYMRDWLQALKVTDRSPNVLQKSSQPRHIIKRAQTKKRGRTAVMKEMDDFIVGDNAEEEAWFDQFRKKETVPDSTSQESIASMSTLTDQHDLDFGKSTRLANVIVIEGPSGCGKTSSVYGCASELGYEIFELFPGMGKRSGVTLSAMVGDLCRNHMVSSGGTGGGAFQGKDSKTKPNGEEANSTGFKSRQSLILVEEADTMYEDDKGFWLGLIELAGQSLRPIILTCNDISAIPVQGLPLQKILKFSKPSTQVAIPYLQLICLCEGHQVDPIKTLVLYLGRIRTDEQLHYNEELILPMHGPLANLQTDDIAEFKCDLRQAIMQLQYDCEVMKPSEPTLWQQYPKKTLRQLIQFTVLKSFVDSTFARPFGRAVAELEFEQFAPNPDEVQVVGKAIYHSPLKGAEICLPMYGRESDYVSILLANEGGWLNLDYSNLLYYHQNRAIKSKEIQDILESQNVNLQSRMPSLEGILDYAPFIHKMTLIDDQEEFLVRQSVEAMLKEGIQEEANLIAKGYSRQKTNLIRKQDFMGLLNLTVREMNFMRWLLLDNEQVERARRIAPSLYW